MAPNGAAEGLPHPEYANCEDHQKSISNELVSQRQPLKWLNIVAIAIVHMMALWAITIIPIASIYTVIFCFTCGVCAGFGVTGGVHRLWTHRSYKANLPFRVFLAICYSMAGQNTIPQWVQDHRVHHKYSETDADPHNSRRGFFFAHVGWLMQKKHPQVLLKGKTVDMSDVYRDPVVRFHTKYFIQLKMIFCFILPMAIPCYYWGETFYVSFFGNILRYCLSLNETWAVNSAAHIFGNRPYNNQIRPAENIWVSLVALGEGWHNYHHVFPWDYKAAELGWKVNPTTFVIDTMAKIGAATDLKQPSRELIQKIASKYGDGSYHTEHHSHMQEVDENGVEVQSE